MASIGPSSQDAFFKQVLKSSYGKSIADRGLVPGSRVSIYVLNVNTGKATIAGMAVVSASAEGSRPRTHLHGHDLADNFIVLESVHIFSASKQIPYPYPFRSTDDVPKLLGDLHKNGYYAWDSRALHLIIKPPGPANLPQTKSKNTFPANQQQSALQTPNTNSPAIPVLELDNDGNIIDTDAPNSGFLRDTDGKRFKQRRLIFSEYTTMTVHAYIDQIRDFPHPLRKIDEGHRDELQKAFLDTNVGYQESAGMMSVTLQSTDCHRGVNFSEMFETNSVGQLILRKGFTLTIVDGRHRLSSINNIIKMEGEQYNWSRQRFMFSCIVRKDNNLLSSWEILMLGSNKNQNSCLVKNDTTLFSLLSTVISYSGIFEETYGISFLEACTTDISLDMELSGFLGSLSSHSYKRYVRVAKFLITYPRVRQFLFENTTIGNSTNSRHTHITFISDAKLISASEENAILMLGCANEFLKDGNNRFFPSPFYASCLKYIAELSQYFVKLSSVSNRNGLPDTFESFLDSSYPTSKTSSQTIRQTFVNNLKAFNYNPHDPRSSNESRVKGQLTRLRNKLDDYYYGGSTGSLTPQVGSKRSLIQSSTGTVDLTATPDETSLRRSLRTKRRKRSDVSPALSQTKVISTPGSKDMSMSSSRSGSMGATSESTVHDPLIDEANIQNSTNMGMKMTSGMNMSNNLTELNMSKSSTVMTGSSGKRANDRTEKQAKTMGSTSKTNDESHGSFDDVFDPSVVPFGYEDKHTFWSLKSTDYPDDDFIRNFRKHPRFRNEEMEDEWDRSHVIQLPRDNSVTTIDTTAYLHSIFIPYEHRANIYLTVPIIKYIRSLAWAWGVKKELYRDGGQLSSEISILSQWKNAFNEANLPFASAFYGRKKIELMEAGYCILDDMADPMTIPTTILDISAKPPDGMSNMSLSQFFTQILQQFPGEQFLAEEKNRQHWNPIVNTGDEVLDENNRNRGIARYSTTNMFLTTHLEGSVQNIELAVRRSYLDVWVCMLLALMGVDNDGKWKCRIPSTGGRALISGKGLSDQNGHNDFEYRKGLCPGFFVIVTGNDLVHLWVCKSSHQYIWYSDADKRDLADLMVLSQIQIQPNSIFIGHGYLQHAGSGWRGFHSLRYHMYIIPDDLVLPDAIHFSFQWSFRREGQDRAQDDGRSTRRNGDSKRNNNSNMKSTKSVSDSSEESSVDDDEEVDADDDALFIPPVNVPHI